MPVVDVSERARRTAARARVGPFGAATPSGAGPCDVDLDGSAAGEPPFLPAPWTPSFDGPGVDPTPGPEALEQFDWWLATPPAGLPALTPAPPQAGEPETGAASLPTSDGDVSAVPAPADPAPPTSAPQPTPPVPPRPARARRIVRATVLAVLLSLLGGGATALALGKTITVTVDGEERTLHTFAGDVAGALRAAGIDASEQDRVEPALPTELDDGDHVIVSRARPLTLVEGGSQRQVWTTAASVDDALRNMGLEIAPVQMSVPPDAVIPLAGMAVELSVPRTVSLIDGAGAPMQLTTTAGTVGGLLAERGVQLGPDDVAVPAGDTVLTDGTAVHVVRNGVGEVVEVRRIEPPEQVVEDPGLPRGEREVVDPGEVGEQAVVLRVHVQNGREVRREQVLAGSSTPPEPRVVKVGTAEPPPAAAPAVDDGAVWDRIARCEATGDWSIDTGNGYYGGLQFDRQTWRAYGGDRYAALPHQASRAEQIAVARKVRDNRGGYGSWPACARKLGLPR